MKELVKEIRAIREVLEDELSLPEPADSDPVEDLPLRLRGAVARASRRPRPYRPMCEAMPAMFEPPLPPLPPKERRRFDDDDEGGFRRRRR